MSEPVNPIDGDHDALQFDRTMTITGIILAVLILAALCITAYCMAKQKKDDFFRHKADRERLMARAKKSSFSEVKEVPKPVTSKQTRETNAHINGDIEEKQARSMDTQTDPDWLIGREMETSLSMEPSNIPLSQRQRGPPADNGSHSRHQSGSPPTYTASRNRDRLPSNGSGPPQRSISTTSAIVESDHDVRPVSRQSSRDRDVKHADDIFGRPSPPRHRHSEQNMRPNPPAARQNADLPRQHSQSSMRGSQDPLSNRDSRGSRLSEYDNHDLDVTNGDLQPLNQSREEIKGSIAELSSSPCDSPCSDEETSSLFPKMKPKKADSNHKNMNGDTELGQVDDTPYQMFAPYSAPKNAKPESPPKDRTQRSNQSEASGRRSSNKNNHNNRPSNRKDSDLQERIRQELESENGGVPV